MTRAFRRDLLFAGGLLLCLASYGLLQGAMIARTALGLAALGVVLVHALGADEVRRAASYRAAFAAFMLAAAVSLGLALLGRPDLVARAGGHLWAWLFGLYLLSWAALRPWGR